MILKSITTFEEAKDRQSTLHNFYIQPAIFTFRFFAIVELETVVKRFADYSN
jgi:hypothetical protein